MLKKLNRFKKPVKKWVNLVLKKTDSLKRKILYRLHKFNRLIECLGNANRLSKIKPAVTVSKDLIG